MSALDAGRTFERADIEADLLALQEQLEARFSYLHFRGVDYRGLLESMRRELPERVVLDDFCRGLARFLALFDDGHAGVSGRGLLPGERFAPLLLGEDTSGVFASLPERRGLLDDRFPYLRSLDGLDLATWLQAAGRLRGGTPQWRRRAALAGVARIELLRRELGLPVRDDLTLELGEAGGRARTMKLALEPRRPRDRRPPASEHRILPGGVGYLRIASMDPRPEQLDRLAEAMAALRSTVGLIVDLRENGGGSRLPLRLLFPFFMASSDGPRVGNLAKHRLGPGDPPDAPEGYLADRFLFPRNASAFSPEEREAIDRFAETFRPEWNPPPHGFSEWHYLVLSRRTAPAGVYHYTRPVVLLIDAACFSATDVFVGAFQGWRNVTLLGTATGGGSGRARAFELPRTETDVRFSTMASFRPNGLLYEGRGIEPDVLLPATMDDWFGKTDTALEAARRRLTQ